MQGRSLKKIVLSLASILSLAYGLSLWNVDEPSLETARLPVPQPLPIAQAPAVSQDGLDAIAVEFFRNYETANLRCAASDQAKHFPDVCAEAPSILAAFNDIAGDASLQMDARYNGIAALRDSLGHRLGASDSNSAK